MPFAIQRIWREHQNDTNDCYFCMVDISRFRKTKNRHDIAYPFIPSLIAPVPHNSELPVPKPQCHKASEDLALSEDIEEDSDDNFNISQTYMSAESHFSSQKEVDDLVRDLVLTKLNAKLLISRLKEWNLLDLSCRCSSSRKWHEQFSKYFSMVGSLCFCSIVDKLFEELGIVHDTKEWRLFIDSSSRSLKCVLLHNGNHYPSIPIGHSVQMKEDHNNVKFVLENINYTRYNWPLCGDFKMIGFLKKLQGGYTKYSCFLCLWESRAVTEHYSRKKWLERRFFVPGTQNVKHDSLVDSEKILDYCLLCT